MTGHAAAALERTICVLTVFADHGSFTISLMFGGPVALLLVTLCGLTVRERRRERGGRG